ncbi:hypothetical protein KIMH_13830 [Bombiscardovia apis]|uniref:Bacterial Pleckstrin homology domain-containing protein n=1 Tax=Bombiscardovia apis TaxID=2932182 RepID=A0ABM8BEB8_9BIFI|nr:hypothetical protein [Bombiscardovia apis]BDR55272.1 hypothetical protein KIMH_13830 [Bombiscardovia apis]
MSYSNDVELSETTLVVEPRGINKVLALKGRLEIPLEHILGATEDPGILDQPKGLRDPGTAVGGKWAGTFVQDDEKSFWNVTRPERPVVIQLVGERYARLILGVEHPRELVDHINALLVSNQQ